MTWEAVRVTLVGGEEVELELGSVCNEKQIFVRMGENFVVGVVDSLDDHEWNGVYIWHKVQDVYKYLGDITFREQADRSVIWGMYPSIHYSCDELKRRAMDLIVKQGTRVAEAQVVGMEIGNHIKMLSSSH